jgi:C1A family cysteine protease
MNKVALASVFALVSGNIHDRSFYEAKFHDWLQVHKVHVKNGGDFVHMLQNFANNDDIIETHNSENHTYQLGHNEYSHMSFEEFSAYMRFGLGKPDREPADHVHADPGPAYKGAASVDWTTQTGVVTPVKNQGNCGSCWSFSATGALEGVYSLVYPQSASWSGFSEQELVSCNTKVPSLLFLFIYYSSYL